MVTTVAVVLAGGTGTRLYPASRADRPKQFQSFGGERSLLERAVDRAGVADEQFVLTRAAYAERVRNHVPSATVLVEPEPRDTGPALVYAAHRVRELVDDPVVFAMPSDHVVGEGFAETARRAISVATETDGIVTVGVAPTRPATEYGYVQLGAAEDGYAEVVQFREKPDEETAREFVDEGFLWNAGMFAFRPGALLREARASPLASLVEALEADRPDAGFDETASVSIDYAVLEGATDVFVVPTAVTWDDLGSWDALARLLDGENAVLGEALSIDASGNVVASDDKHVSVLGVDDLVVAAYDDRVLVVPKAEAQRVREVVAALRETGAF
ncbi:MAG: mannose-1-phosphate guanylyltransferase [Halanaeroarchaeum sp.]